VTIWAVGCVVPAPLQAEQGGPPTAPRITSGSINGQETPYFGSFTESTADWTLGVTASDPDPNAKLVARLYSLQGGLFYKLSFDGGGLPLQPVTNELTTHHADFPSGDYCGLIKSRGTAGTPYPVYVFVADQPFTDLSPPNQFTLGQSDFKSWSVTCQ
jgi:hypothetical protein